MLFHLTADKRVEKLSDDTEITSNFNVTFKSEREFKQLANKWPMKVIVEIWNRLPHVTRVTKFRDRQNGLNRIWKFIQALPTKDLANLLQRAPASEQVEIGFRLGSKAAQVCALLKRAEGALLEELEAGTGWQRHSIRGFISGALVKRGLTVHSSKREGKRSYRLQN